MPYPQSYFPDDTNMPLPGSENEDPRLVRNPYYLELMAKNAALRGLQLSNDSTQQRMDLADPERQAVVKNDLIARHQTDAPDQHDLDMLKNTLGIKNDAQLSYEGDPRHINALDSAAMGKVAPALAVQQLKNDAAAGKPQKLDADSSKRMRALMDAEGLSQQILPMIDKLDASASDYRNGSFLSKLPGVGYGSYQNYLYSKGMPVDELTGKLDQLVALNQALSVSGMTTGRPSAMWINMLKQHLADPSQSLGEIRSRVSDMANLIPMFKQHIQQAAAGDYSGGAATDPMGIR